QARARSGLSGPNRVECHGPVALRASSLFSRSTSAQVASLATSFLVRRLPLSVARIARILLRTPGSLCCSRRSATKAMTRWPSGPQARHACIGSSRAANPATATPTGPIQRPILTLPLFTLPRSPTRRHLMLEHNRDRLNHLRSRHSRAGRNSKGAALPLAPDPRFRGGDGWNASIGSDDALASPQ